MSLSLFFFILTMICMAGVVAALFYGLLAPRKTVGDSRKSNKAMQLRVWLQGGALLFLILSALSR